MALTTHTPTHAAASSGSSAASALSAIKPPTRARAGGADDDGDFAAQLLRAQPQETKPSDADSKASSASKDESRDDDKDGKPADGAPDPATLFPWAQQLMAPQAAAQAGKGGADALGVGGLRKGLGKGGKDAGADALGAGKDGKADPAALSGKGERSATDVAAALGKAGADNLASDTKDSMAALLPQPDPTTVQAGAIGASTTAVMDYRSAAEQASASAPAQASLPMTPQSPAFAPALGQQIEVWMRDGVQHAEVQLSPQDLGPIRVKIAVDGADTRVEMSADVASTRDALQQALPQLSDQLGQVGLSLTGGGVSDQSTAQSQGQFQQGADAGAAGRPGATRAGLGGSDAAGTADLGAATAARQAAQRRGLLDMYA